MLPKFIFQAATLLPLLYHIVYAQSARACNNSPSLCDRSYSNITQLGAHNSPFVRDASTSFSISGNQFYNSTVQLDAGVRLLTAQVHSANSSTGTREWHLCHTACDLLNAGRLRDWLGRIKTWLDGNTNDVVTLLLVNSDDATASELAGEFTASGIQSYAYTPPSTSVAPTTAWPTLAELIASNTRLITFVADLNPTANTVAPYLLDEFTFVFENNYDNTSPSDFSCQPNRPASVANNPSAALSSNRLFLMNHLLYQTQAFGIQVPDTDQVNTTNGPGTEVGSLEYQSKTCTQFYGRKPWSVLVDFFNVGPAIESVDTLNGVYDATGRRTISTSAVQESTSMNAALSGRTRWSSPAMVVGVVVAAALTSGW